MARGEGSDPPAMAGGSGRAVSASTTGASTTSRGRRADAPRASASCASASAQGRRPDPPRPDLASPPVPVHRQAARAGRGRGPAASRSGLDGSASWSCPSVSGGPRRKRARRAPVSAASADWFRLPEDLLVAVMGELEVIDLVRAGAACSSWHAAFATFRRLRLPSPKQPPCLLYSDYDGDPDVAVLRAPSSSSSPSYRAPPTIRAPLPGLPLTRRTFVGSGYGWLVTADEASNLHVVNPLTGAQVALPPLATLHNVDTSTGEGGDLTYRVFSNRDADREPTATFTAVKARETMYPRAVLSCSPSAGAACVVLLLHWPDGELSFARLGDELWTPVSAAGGHDPLQRSGYRDALYEPDSGLFYMLHRDGAIFTVDLNRESPSASRIMPLATAICDPVPRHFMNMYLARAPSGDLLQVCRRIVLGMYQFRHPPYTDDNEDFVTYLEIETDDLQVYMVDLHGQSREKITTLGDHSLFLGYNNSMCVSTKDLPMLEPNLAYLTDDCYQCVYTETESSRDMGIFRVGETPVYRGMYRRLNERCFPFCWLCFPVPIWIAPSVY